MRRLSCMALAMMIGISLAAQEKVNVTYSPDSTMTAYTKANDLYVSEVATGKETRLTFDGTDLILNGYASWVYYEEIFGRYTKYKAFWWSPDSRKIGFYRFDNTNVTFFPIFSPFGQDGKLVRTRYPKAGEANPEVRIGIADLDKGGAIVWADFDEKEDQYFGTPFWGPDSKGFYVSHMPRLQQELNLYSVSAADGSKTHIYHENYSTWISWMDNVTFTDKGLYMVRSFETGWEQIYFLSYDGLTFKRLTDGPNWNMSILRVDEKKGDIWFRAKRTHKVRPAIYKVNRKGVVTELTDSQFSASYPSFSKDGKYFTVNISNARTPVRNITCPVHSGMNGKYVVNSDKAGNYDMKNRPQPQIVMIENDNFQLYGAITYPKGFSEKGSYPVLVELYGGPGTPVVRDEWRERYGDADWCYENGIIYICVDPRSSGENGRSGMDEAYRHVTVVEMKDYIAWAKWLQSKPYVKADKIGVEGFSFGGTSTVMLLCQASDYFHYGVAGGGVYDWTFYDSHYTERFMDTPQNNPEGYRIATALNYVEDYPVTYDNYDGSKLLKLTHGTGDDNVHFQNTLCLIDALQKAGKKFDLMIYPDGMHGYGGYQHTHDKADDHEFWSKYLLGIKKD